MLECSSGYKTVPPELPPEEVMSLRGARALPSEPDRASEPDSAEPSASVCAKRAGIARLRAPFPHLLSEVAADEESVIGVGVGEEAIAPRREGGEERKLGQPIR